MLIAWTIAGIILGWFSIEVLASATKTSWTYTANFGLAFVGGLTAFTIAESLLK